MGTALESSIVLVIAASGCGRYSFDGQSSVDSGADAVEPDANLGSTFSPVSSPCTQAQNGPFGIVDTFPNSPNGAGYGVFAALPNIVVANEAGGINNLHIDGGKFTQMDHLDGGFVLPEQLGWVEAVWSDGQHFYAGSPGRGMYVMDIGTDGKFIRLADNKIDTAQARKGWSAGGGLQFVADGDGGVKAMRYTGSALETVGMNLPMTSWAQGAWAIGNRVILADAGALRVADFDGTAYSETITPNTAQPGSTRLWVDRKSIIFVANNAGVTAYRINGSTIDLLDTFATADAARDVWSDGTHVFVAASTDGTYALAFTNDAFILVDHADSGGSTLGVFGDGKYVYTNDQNIGLRAWSGFTCQQW